MAISRGELRSWIEDALGRHERDTRERDEQQTNVSVAEIVDAVWGRLPLEIRRQVTRAQVQASLTMLTLQRGVAARPGSNADTEAAVEQAELEA